MNSAIIKLQAFNNMQAVNKTESASRVDQLSMQIVSLLFQECVCSGVTRYYYFCLQASHVCQR